MMRSSELEKFDEQRQTTSLKRRIGTSESSRKTTGSIAKSLQVVLVVPPNKMVHDQAKLSILGTHTYFFINVDRGKKKSFCHTNRIEFTSIHEKKILDNNMCLSL